MNTRAQSNTTNRGDWVLALGGAAAFLPVSVLVGLVQNTALLTMVGLAGS